jgi:hypothetical protein
MKNDKRIRIVAAVSVIFLSFGFFYLVSDSIERVRRIKISDEDLTARRSSLLNRWRVASNSDSAGKALFLESGESYLVATDTWLGLYSLEGQELSVGTVTFPIGIERAEVRKNLGNPSNVRGKQGKNLTEDVHIIRNAAGLSIVRILVLYRDGIAQKYTIQRVVKTLIP